MTEQERIKDIRLAIALCLTREFAWDYEKHSYLLRYLMSKYNIFDQSKAPAILRRAFDEHEL